MAGGSHPDENEHCGRQELPYNMCQVHCKHINCGLLSATRDILRNGYRFDA